MQIDRRRAQELGLNIEEVAEQARYALNGGFTRKYYNRYNLRQNSMGDMTDMMIEFDRL